MLRRATPFILALVLIATGFSQLHRYGVTWDEALGDYFFGQRYLSFFTSFDARYLDFAHDPYPPGFVPDLRASEFRSRPWEYWPVANTLAAATSRLLSNGLGVVDPFDGFHAFNLLAAAALLLVLFKVLDRYALVATLLLFLMPRVFFDLMANIKDFPEMVFFSVALLVFFHGYERGSTWEIVASGLVWGLALGTKANALFLPLIVIAYVAIRRPASRRIWIAVAAAAVAGVAVMFASWPYFWAAPIDRLLENVHYLTFRSAHANAQSMLNPWVALALTTPPVVIVLFLASLPLAIVRAVRREPLSLFFVLWFGIIAARISAGIVNFDGVRHFLEIFPPIAAIAAIGAVEFARRFRVAVAAVLLAIPVCATAYATISTHPFEIAYWNAFCGGLAGAQARSIPSSCDYWASSYRVGLDWINRNVPKGSVLIVPIAGHTVKLVAPIRLRPDIRFVSYPRDGGPAAAAMRISKVSAAASRVPVYVMFVPRPDWSTELDADCMRRLQPERVWSLNRAPVLLIYRYRAAPAAAPTRSPRTQPAA